MTATPSTEKTRGPEAEIIATASSTEQAVDAGGCGGACCAPGTATTDLTQASVEQRGNDQADRAGCGCGCG